MKKTLAALAAVTVIGGCAVPGSWEGGSRVSDDKHVYVSRPYEPKTISVVNTATGETIWTVEIPVGEQLIVRFYDNKHDDPIMSANMRWEITEETTDFRRMTNLMTVPGRDFRRIDMELRDTPEFPPAADADD